MTKPLDSRAISRETLSSAVYTWILGCKPKQMLPVCSGIFTAFSLVASGEGKFSDISPVIRKDSDKPKQTMEAIVRPGIPNVHMSLSFPL